MTALTPALCDCVGCENKCYCLDASSAGNPLSVASSSVTAIFLFFIFMNVVFLLKNIELFMKHLDHEVMQQQTETVWWSYRIP
jgi:hypothetical protein